MIGILEHGTEYKARKTFLCPLCRCKFWASIDHWVAQEIRYSGFPRIKTICRCPECGADANEIKETEETK